MISLCSVRPLFNDTIMSSMSSPGDIPPCLQWLFFADKLFEDVKLSPHVVSFSLFVVGIANAMVIDIQDEDGLWGAQRRDLHF